MGRILFFVLFIVLLGYALTFGISYRGNLAREFSTESAPLPEAIEPGPTDFSETGTLVFYPNNLGPVPYVFYQDQSGHAVAKALVFLDSPPNNFSSWTGAHISVTGQVVAEHVVVNTIAYLSGP